MTTKNLKSSSLYKLITRYCCLKNSKSSKKYQYPREFGVKKCEA